MLEDLLQEITDRGWRLSSLCHDGYGKYFECAIVGPYVGDERKFVMYATGHTATDAVSECLNHMEDAVAHEERKVEYQIVRDDPAAKSLSEILGVSREPFKRRF